MKTKLSLCCLLLACLLASCNKTCHCYGYDSTSTFFSEEEVKARNAETCSQMIYFDQVRLYAICEWDY